MNRLNRFVCLLLSFAAPTIGSRASAQSPQEKPESRLKAVLLSAGDVTADRLESVTMDGYNVVAIVLRGDSEAARKQEKKAAERVTQSKLDLYYWIEIAHNPDLADAHPEWMASLQGHQEWRRLFKDAPVPEADEVVKVYPWVPILYKEAFQAQLDRVGRLLKDNPESKGVFLNDLQGAPSACGCGNPLCRWTGDYGPIHTATQLGPDAAARFVTAVQKLAPQARVVPVWVTECEQHDGAKDGLCAGVGCFKGICWKAWTAQLMPLVKESERVGVLLPFREFQRDLPVYGERASWIAHAVKSFQEMPPRRGGTAVPASQLITVLQGWDVAEEDVAAQVRMAESAGVGGYVVAYSKVDQSWRPKIVQWK